VSSRSFFLQLASASIMRSVAFFTGEPSFATR
jgi:hypothetical protein